MTVQLGRLTALTRSIDRIPELSLPYQNERRKAREGFFLSFSGCTASIKYTVILTLETLYTLLLPVIEISTSKPLCVYIQVSQLSMRIWGNEGGDDARSTPPSCPPFSRSGGR